MMEGDGDKLQGLSVRMDIARRRNNTIKRISLKIDNRSLTDGTYQNGLISL